MEGRVLSDSLVCLSGNDLRMVYSLFCKTSVIDLLRTKAKEKLNSDLQNQFIEHLNHEVKNLEDVPDSRLQVKLLLQIMKTLDIKGQRLELKRELDDMCESIIQQVYSNMIEEEGFKQFSERNAHLDKVKQMIHYQMTLLLRQVDQKIHETSTKNQEDFVEEIKAYIQKLPAEKQQQVKEKLGIDELTNSVLKKFISTSGVSLLFAGLVEVTGFAFYTTATTLLASIVGLVGITLPFAVYTTLTSVIAVLASPFFIIPVLFGGGAFFVHHQNKKLKKKLLPVVLVQIILPYLSEENKIRVSHNHRSFFEEWKKQKNDYLATTIVADEAKRRITSMEKEMKNKNQSINKARDLQSSLKKDIKGLRDKIYQALENTDLSSIHGNPSFEEKKNILISLQKNILDMELSKKSSRSIGGFGEKAQNMFFNLKKDYQITSKEVDAKNIRWRLVDILLESDMSFLENKRHQMDFLQKQIEGAKEEESFLKKERDKLAQDKKELEKMLSQCKDLLKEKEKEFYGMSHLVFTDEEKKEGEQWLLKTMNFGGNGTTETSN